jgi:hypothetical protein
MRGESEPVSTSTFWASSFQVDIGFLFNKNLTKKMIEVTAVKIYTKLLTGIGDICTRLHNFKGIVSRDGLSTETIACVPIV